MNVVSAVTSKIDQLRNRLFLSSLNRTQKVIIHSARLSIARCGAVEKIRVRILVRASGIVESEPHAEACLQEIIRSYEDGLPGDLELKKLKPRVLRPTTMHDESEGILQLLQKMRCEASQAVTSVEPLDGS